MVVLPADTPVTLPEPSTVPTDKVTLLQIPPVVASVKIVFEPAQTIGVPAMVPALGVGLTVTTCVAAAVPQLLVTVYDIVVVPVAMPLTTPEVPTVPVDGLTLLHAPPVAASVKAVLAPVQTVGVPEIVPAFGRPFTVTTCVAVQPVVVLETVIVVVPAATAVTTPPGLVIVATPGLLLVQVLPLPDKSVSVEVPPTQRLNVPLIGPIGVTFTVVLPVAVMPQTSVMVSVYTVVAAGVTVAGVPATAPGLHENV